MHALSARFPGLQHTQNSSRLLLRPPPAPLGCRPLLAGAAASSFEAQLEGLVASPACFSSCDEYLAEGCLALELDLAEVVDSWSDQEPGERGQLAFELCREVIRQHAASIGGLVRGVRRTSWDKVSRVEFAVRAGEAAQHWLVGTAQAQALLVQLRGRSVHIPASVAAARLPPAHAQVEFRGVPFYYSKPGFTEAFLRGAGYSREQGVEVVHERAGIVLGPLTLLRA